MKRNIKERFKNKILRWNKIDKTKYLTNDLFYIYGGDDILDVKIKGYYKDDILCLLNFHITDTYIFHPLNLKKTYSYFKKFILEPTIEGLKKIEYKGKVGFEKMEFEQLNNYIRIMLKRNNIQFQENEKYIYVECNFYK